MSSEQLNFPILIAITRGAITRYNGQWYKINFCPTGHRYNTPEIKFELEGDVLMITSGNNASKNECPIVGTDESQ